MKAITYENYGAPDVLKMIETEKPIPKDNEILIKICATTATSGDSRLRRADPFFTRFMTGFFKPKKNLLGFDISGVVESIGKLDQSLFLKGNSYFFMLLPKLIFKLSKYLFKLRMIF